MTFTHAIFGKGPLKIQLVRKGWYHLVETESGRALAGGDLAFIKRQFEERR